MTNPMRPKAEFDDYAVGYDAGMENALKAKLGNSADDFIQVKLNWFCRRFSNIPWQSEVRLLDFGCGAGALLMKMAEQGWTFQKAGCDISSDMLEQAKERWDGNLAEAPHWSLQENSATAFEDGSFDFVVISAVLHHIPPEERDATLSEIWRVLASGGTIIVFEHNPHNPVTRYVVANTPIDANAVLLSPRETKNRLIRASFEPPNTDFIMFAPPKMKNLSKIDRYLGWLPLGAQYAMWASKP